MAIPSRVVASDGAMATVECFGVQRRVSLMLLAEPVSVGDYLLVQAGGYAFEKVEQARALESLALMKQILEAGAPADPLPDAA